jgi:hypothetical protein
MRSLSDSPFWQQRICPCWLTTASAPPAWLSPSLQMTSEEMPAQVMLPVPALNDDFW